MHTLSPYTTYIYIYIERSGEESVAFFLFVKGEKETLLQRNEVKEKDEEETWQTRRRGH